MFRAGSLFWLFITVSLSKGDQEVNISLDLDVCLKNEEWWRENFKGCSNAVGYVSWMFCSCRLSKSDAKFLPELDEDLISGLVIDSSWLVLDFKKNRWFFSPTETTKVLACFYILVFAPKEFLSVPFFEKTLQLQFDGVPLKNNDKASKLKYKKNLFDEHNLNHFGKYHGIHRATYNLFKIRKLWKCLFVRKRRWCKKKSMSLPCGNQKPFIVLVYRLEAFRYLKCKE